MASKRTLAQRLSAISTKSKLSPVQTLNTSSPSEAALSPGNGGIFRRVLQRRRIYQSAATSPKLRSLPRGEELVKKLRGMDVYGDRIRLEGLCPPAVASPEIECGLEDVRKVLRAWQVEVVRSKLREIEREHINLPEFVQICSEVCSKDEDVMDLVKTMDESGTVIVLGNIAYLRPDKLMKIVRGLIPMPTMAQPEDKKQYEDLKKMEKEKAAIDRRAEMLVRRELWLGLSYLVFQTAAFARLTFWEFSWDVMEPICFFVTSTSSMASYAFFLSTSKEPSFQSFYKSRFRAKQKRLMEKLDFDAGKYIELRSACRPSCSPSSSDCRGTHSVL